MFVEKDRIDVWPHGIHAGKTVVFFNKVGPFVARRIGDKWIVADSRLGNKRGGPHDGVWFNSEKEAWDHVNMVH